MIVREAGGELWLFDQRDHSALCGTMAAAWGADGFGAVPEPVVRAADIHDSGWPEWDVRPRLDARTGRPHPYSDMPADDYRDIWRRGLDRGWAVGEQTGLLVSLHAMRFFGRKTEPEDRLLLAEQRSRQSHALRSLGATGDDPEALPEPFSTWHTWMFFWDGFSLFLCEGWKSPWSSRLPTGTGGEQEVRVVRSCDDMPGGEVRVDPFPFDADLSLGVAARVLPLRTFRSQGELDDAVGGAPTRRIEWHIRGRPDARG